ncbi:MAG TPA: IclR family transcriptional regulator C-terminal domain-containing protein, partial [Actinomycetota bacterium]
KTGSNRTAVAKRAPDFVQSLDRGLAVIRAFDSEHPRLTLSEVAREAGLTRAAARRFLLTLVELGYVRSDGREFSLRPRVLELGYAYLSGMSLPEVAYPHMQELVDRVQESSSVSVLDGDEIVDIARVVPAKRIMTVAVPVGTRFRAHASSKGRVLLASLSASDLDGYLDGVTLDRLTTHTVTSPKKLRAILDEVRSQGFAVVDQEVEEGIRSIAVPVRDASGSVIAAINISAYASRVSLGAVRGEFLPALLATAGQIEADLRAQGNRRRPGS